MKAAIGCLIGLVFVVSVSAEPLLEGRVRLESGEPVADAQVRIFDLSDLRQGAIARAMTDRTGYFSLPLAVLGGRALPARFALGPNYPNPFNPSTIIPYQLAASAAVRLEVFNLLGQRITTLVDGERAAGFHTATWHATDGAGRAVGAGVYIYRMRVGMESQTGRMVLLDGQAGVSAGGAASVMPGASGIGGSDGADAQVYGLIVSGRGLVPYVDSSFRVEAGMAPVELVVSAGQPSAGKATDDDCAFCDLFGTFNDQQEEEADETEEEEAETDSTSSEGGPDLIVQSPSVSTVMLTPGQTFTLNATVHNQGDEQAAATMLHYYRSNNATITSSDTEVGTDAVGALDASATSAKSIALTAPTSVSAEEGIYYGACVASVRGESNTDNNCSSAVKITVSGQEATEDEETEEEEAGEATEEEEEDDTPVTIPDANLRAAIEDALGKAKGATVTVAEMKTLRSLKASDAGISDLTGLEFAANLTRLDLGVNKLTDVSALSGLTKLRELTLWVNKLTDVSALSGLTKLRELRLGGNKLTDVSALSGLINLRSLQLNGNPISDISALSSLTNLQDLGLGHNSFTDFSALSGLTNLRDLWLDSATISDFSVLSGLTNLRFLSLWNNKLTDVSALSGLTYLIVLRLGGNNLTDLSALSGLTNLELLYLGDNNLTDLSALSGLTNLRDLSLWDNKLTDVSALSGLTYLRSLELANNNLTDVSPLRNLANLASLDLRGNPLNVSSVNDHIPALERSGATVHFDPPLRESDFDIELVFLDDHFTEKHKQKIRYAARRWMSIIREDLPDHTFANRWSGGCGDQSYAIPSGERIDDLRIYVIARHLVGGIAGQGGPSVLRTTGLPVIGCVQFDLESVTSESVSSLFAPNVTLHEIGHVLGIGTIWDDFIQNPSGDPHFTGPLAIAAFNAAGGRDYAGAKVPVERSVLGHWRAPVLEGELMVSDGSGNALSAITIQALADLGWVVDVTQADAYTLPGAAAKASAKIAAPSTHAQPELSCGVGQAREPIYVVDEQGNIIRTISSD